MKTKTITKIILITIAIILLVVHVGLVLTSHSIYDNTVAYPIGFVITLLFGCIAFYISYGNPSPVEEPLITEWDFTT